MKKSLFLLVIFLSSCSNVSSINYTQDDKLNNLFFASKLADEDLNKPNEVIHSLDEFIYTLDYLAFYQIEGKVSFYIDDNYAKTFYNIYQEFNKAEEQVLIADVYPTFIDYSLYINYKIITLNMVISDIAIKHNDRIEATSIYEIDYKKDNYQCSFPLEKISLNEINVRTSQQLYYAIENHYKVKLVQNSIAEKIYNEAKKILSSIVDDKMSEYEKAKQIYNYLCSEVSYDYLTSAESSYDLNQNQAYFLEGVFLNHNAVCDGKSKAYSFLSNMVGIDNVRVTAINDKYQGHAYNYIKIDNKWYLSCTTYGSHKIELKENNFYIVPSLNMFLSSLETPYLSNWSYDSKMHEDIKNKIEKTSFPEIEEIQDLNALKNKIQRYQLNSLSNIEIEFQYFKDINLFKEEIEKEYSQYEVVVLKNQPLAENYYSIIFLDNI